SKAELTRPNIQACAHQRLNRSSELCLAYGIIDTAISPTWVVSGVLTQPSTKTSQNPQRRLASVIYAIQNETAQSIDVPSPLQLRSIAVASQIEISKVTSLPELMLQ